MAICHHEAAMAEGESRNTEVELEMRVFTVSIGSVLGGNLGWV